MIIKKNCYNDVKYNARDYDLSDLRYHERNKKKHP